MHYNLSKLIVAVAVLVMAVVEKPAGAQTIQAPFESFYSFTDLGSVPGVPSRNGGVNFLLGNPNKLIIGGSANSFSGGIYAIDVVRDGNGHITGLSGEATRIIDAPYNDGGVAYGPGNVLFLSRWPQNELGQSKPGSSTTDKVINLAPLGVEYSHAAINFVPAGFPGAGRMKLVSWSGGEWSDAQYAPDGFGTFDILSVTPVPASRLNVGPEGFFYVPPLSPGFPNRSLLVAEYNLGSIGAYDVDANGDPIIESRRVFMNGLSGAEGGVIDPVSGDFVFTTFGGGDRLVVVRGFVPNQIGDTDGDGDVDVDDYRNVHDNFGSGVGGDTDGDLDTDIADINNVMNHFGEDSNNPGGAGAAAAVPEPAAWMLLALGLPAALVCRRTAAPRGI